MDPLVATHTIHASAGQVRLPISRLTAEQYLDMARSGILGPDAKVELIEGYIVPTAPSGEEHSGSLIDLVDLFAPVMARFRIAIQVTLPLGAGYVFDPDLMLLHRRPKGYRRHYARPEDIALIVECSASSRERDLQVKAPIYAAAGIVEYWVIDLVDRRVVVHRSPAGPAYADVTSHGPGATVAPLAAPELVLAVSDLVGDNGEAA